jgi:hypothetical protein
MAGSVGLDSLRPSLDIQCKVLSMFECRETDYCHAKEKEDSSYSLLYKDPIDHIPLNPWHYIGRCTR